MERKQYINRFGAVYAVREKDGEPRLMCKPSRRGWNISAAMACYMEPEDDWL